MAACYALPIINNKDGRRALIFSKAACFSKVTYFSTFFNKVSELTLSEVFSREFDHSLISHWAQGVQITLI